MADWKKFIGLCAETLKAIVAGLRQITISAKKHLPNWSKNAVKCIYRTWHIVLICVTTFIFFYYFLGSQLAENIDTTTEYKMPKEKSMQMEAVNAMSFLLKREVDDKMWTPNLPPIFPAYVLDNMPNFQIGVVAAIRDMANVLRRMEGLDDAQKEDLQQAHKMLSYAPDIWLLSPKGSFGIAPSSNTQYRKAAKYLQNSNLHTEFTPQPHNLAQILAQQSKMINRLTAKGEEHQREHSSDFIDTKADDVFYYNRGYAFALWQISKSIGTDFKDIIVGYGAYTDWTYLQSSLQQASEFSPLVVRNGKPDGLWSPNHIMEQNFYLMRALAALERIRTTLARGAYAD